MAGDGFHRRSEKRYLATPASIRIRGLIVIQDGRIRTEQAIVSSGTSHRFGHAEKKRRKSLAPKKEPGSHPGRKLFVIFFSSAYHHDATLPRDPRNEKP